MYRAKAGKKEIVFTVSVFMENSLESVKIYLLSVYGMSQVHS